MMRNRAFLNVALLGFLVLVPGLATASPASLSSGAAVRAVAVSGPVISVAPLLNDYGIVNVGSSSQFCFTVSNTGDANLTLSNVTSSDGQFVAAPTSGTISPGGSMSVCVTYAPSSGAAASGSISFLSNASNGTSTINVSGRGNTAPVLDPIGDKTAFAFVNLSFDLTANDAEGDVVTFGAAGLPLGAALDTSTGHFSWTPGASDAGGHTMTFSATDGLASDSETITITVTADNNPPVSNPGGPYAGATNAPITFNGSGSSDPDGDALAYAWDFGDGGTASSAVAPHTYTGAGSYLVTLTVTDNGTPPLSNSATTSAGVLNTISCSVNLKLPPSGTMRVTGGGNQLVGLETTSILVTAINPASVKMSTTYPGAGTVSEISADANKGSSLGDIDGDNFPDLVVSFTRSSINQLLGLVPNNTVITIVITATSTSGVPIRGTAQVKAKGGSGAAVSANAAPNPFNPLTKVSWTLKNAGTTTVKIYSLEGRLVKTLHEGFAPAGTSEMAWNGLDNAGRTVRSGVYFLSVKSTDGNAVQKLYLLK